MIEIAKFTASEAAAATGLSGDTIRDHRRRGYLPKIAGHGRYDLMELLTFGFIARAAKAGMPLVEAYGSAEWVAHSALGYALAAGALDADLAQVRASITLPDPSDAEVERAAVKMAVRAFDRPKVAANRFAVIWPDGRDYFAPTVEDALRTVGSYDDRSGELAMVLDVDAFAQVVARQLPRPAVLIRSAT